MALLDDVRSLQPVLGTLIGNDGTESRLVLLSGTIPIYFQAQQYNIPVDIFISESYPRGGPKIYVRPTANMIVHPNHAHVDREGLVYLPYLADWHSHAAAGTLPQGPTGSGRSGFNLSECMVLVASVFSEAPPLFTRPPKDIKPPFSSTPTTSTSGYNNSDHSYSSSKSSSNSSSNSSSSSSNSSRVYSSLDNDPRSQSHRTPISARELLEDQVTLRLQRALRDTYSRLRVDLDGEFHHQTELVDSRAAVQSNLHQLQATKARLVAAVADVAQRHAQLDAWCAAEEAKAGGAADPLMEMFRPYDEVSEQLVGLTAQSSAIDDALYVLEKALRGYDGEGAEKVGTGGREAVAAAAAAAGAGAAATVVTATEATPATATGGASLSAPATAPVSAPAAAPIVPLSLPVFLKTTRQLAARQFTCKAHIKKINATIDLRTLQGF